MPSWRDEVKLREREELAASLVQDRGFHRGADGCARVARTVAALAARYHRLLRIGPSPGGAAAAGPRPMLSVRGFLLSEAADGAGAAAAAPLSAVEHLLAASGALASCKATGDVGAGRAVAALASAVAADDALWL